MPTPPSLPQPDSADEPLTRTQKIAALAILAFIAGVIVGLFVFGHTFAAFVILLALGICGMAAYLGTAR